MRQCRACGNEIPKNLRVDGKMRNLQSRKFCLTCSPFGSRNTSSKNPPNSRVGINNAELPCVVCERPRGNVKHTSRRCCSCITRLRRYRCKIKAVELLGGKCVRCGWRGHIASFQFHHRDPSVKEFGIGNAAQKSWEFVLKEVQKCELLCANCHTAEHSNVTELLIRELERSKASEGIDLSILREFL